MEMHNGLKVFNSSIPCFVVLMFDRRAAIAAHDGVARALRGARGSHICDS